MYFNKTGEYLFAFTTTKDMVVNFARKVHIDTVYVLEGSDKDE